MQAFELLLRACAVVQRKWYRFSFADLRFTETRAGNAAPFVAQDEQAVSGLRRESLLDDKAESLRGIFSANVPIYCRRHLGTPRRLARGMQRPSCLRTSKRCRDCVPSRFLTTKPKACAGDSGQMVPIYCRRHLGTPRRLARVVQRPSCLRTSKRNVGSISGDDS